MAEITYGIDSVNSNTNMLLGTPTTHDNKAMQFTNDMLLSACKASSIDKQQCIQQHKDEQATAATKAETAAVSRFTIFLDKVGSGSRLTE